MHFAAVGDGVVCVTSKTFPHASLERDQNTARAKSSPNGYNSTKGCGMLVDAAWWPYMTASCAYRRDS